MANRNTPASSTFEEWRVEFNELAADIGDIESGITGSIPALTPTYTTVETAIEGLVVDINNIMNGTYSFSGPLYTSYDLTVLGDSLLNGNVTINGNLILGDQDTDSVTIAADLSSHLIPDNSNTYDIGTVSKTWKDLYLDGTINTSTAIVSTLTNGRLVLSGVNGVLEDSTDFTYSGDLLTVTRLNVTTDIDLVGTGSSTSTSTGSFVTAGGVGIGENLNVAGDVTLGGNLTQLINGVPAIFANQGFSIAIAIALG